MTQDELPAEFPVLIAEDIPGWRSPMIILPALTESGEWLVPLCRCAMKQANVVHRITAAGLVIGKCKKGSCKKGSSPLLAL